MRKTLPGSIHPLNLEQYVHFLDTPHQPLNDELVIVSDINIPNSFHLIPVPPYNSGEARQVSFIRELIRTHHWSSTDNIRVIRADVRPKIDPLLDVNFTVRHFRS